jgi:hypothetical protein
VTSEYICSIFLSFPSKIFFLMILKVAVSFLFSTVHSSGSIERFLIISILLNFEKG